VKQYVGLDVSQRETAVCVIDQDGKILFSRERHLPTLARLPGSSASGHLLQNGSVSRPARWRAGSGRTQAHQPSGRLHRRSPGARPLSVRLNKSDPIDARGLAELIRVGWYREVKSYTGQIVCSLLVARARLVRIRRDLENQIRGLLKEVGMLFPRAIGVNFRTQVFRLVDNDHSLRPIIDSLLALHEQVEKQQAKLDDRVRKDAKDDATTRRLMTVPGVGVDPGKDAASVDSNPRLKGRFTGLGTAAGWSVPVEARLYAISAGFGAGKSRLLGTRSPILFGLSVASEPTADFSGHFFSPIVFS